MLYALNSDTDGGSQVLWEDGERVFCRGWRIGNDGNRSPVLIVVPAAEYPSRSSFDRLAHTVSGGFRHAPVAHIERKNYTNGVPGVTSEIF
jgi:hypothetical protein